MTVDDTASVETEITDSGTVTVSVDDAEADEGAAVSFEVELSGAVGSVVEVSYLTSNGTAESGTGKDYTAASGTLTFRPGEALRQTVSVDTTEDDLDEPDEGFTVTLTVPDGVTVPAGVTVQATAATGTIRDDDVLSAAVSREAATVVEGQWAEFPVTVSDGTSTADVVVAYTVGGSATAGTDYTAPSGELTIGARRASGTIRIETLDDGVLDRGETLVVSLTGASTGTRTVTVDDTASVETEITDSGTVTVSVDDAEADEGAAVSFEVELTGAVGSVVEVSYLTSNGTWGSLRPAVGEDYTAASGTLTFRPGEALRQTVSVDTTEDDLDEPDEGFTVTLTVPDGVTVPAGVTVQATAATGTIRDDDVLSAAVSREAASVVEGQWAEFPVTVSDGTSTADVVVAYTVGGSATAGTDYTAPSGELTIGAGGRAARSGSRRWTTECWTVARRWW